MEQKLHSGMIYFMIGVVLAIGVIGYVMYHPKHKHKKEIPYEVTLGIRDTFYISKGDRAVVAVGKDTIIVMSK
jgi:hypothetical protein